MKLIGKGATAEVYEYEEGKICKLFNLGYPQDAVRREYENALLLQSCELPVPKVYDMVTMEGRDGIIYGRIIGENGIEKIIQGEAANFFPIMFEVHKRILSIHTTQCINYKDFLRMVAEEVPEKKEQLLQQIEQLPEGDALCHGDYHPANLLIQEDGSFVVIDFMNVCHAPREYDIASTYFLLKYSQYEYLIHDNLLVPLTMISSGPIL